MSEKSIKIKNSTIRLIKGDLTDLDVEAIVFYAQSNLELGSGYGNAISMRGGPSIKKELATFDPIDVTEAVVSTAGELKANYIIHANGPKFQEPDTDRKLHDTVRNTLKQADAKGIKIVAFPPMGAGFYGIPLPTCAKIMIEEFRSHLANGSDLEEVLIVAMDSREYKPFEAELQP